MAQASKNTKHAAVYTPIHELTPFRHRVVVLHADATNDPGPWYLVSEIAHHPLGFWANSTPNVFPPGIFRCTSVAHQTLTGSED